MVEQLIRELVKLNLTRGVEWSVGSGENTGSVFGGIAHLPSSTVWEDLDNWVFGDNLEEVLTSMIRLVEPGYAAATTP